MAEEYAYEGSELSLFAQARNWKAYWSNWLRPFIGSRVLDVGAGCGATAELLCSEGLKEWVALEPDPALAAVIGEKCRAGHIVGTCDVRVGRLVDIPDEEMYDTVLYIDVLEHIEDDRGELERAAKHLAPGGHLAVLSPAHAYLFSAFDDAIGHFRRYDRASLRAVSPETLTLQQMDYLDCVGLLASLGNRVVLNSSMPTRKQIQVWDRMMVPISRLLDPIARHRLGKTIVGVWKQNASVDE